MNPYDLTGRRILVTGASSGIGRACAIAASKMGASVVLTGRREDALEDTASGCNGGEYLIVAGDITSPAFIEDLVSKSGKLDGIIDIEGAKAIENSRILAREHGIFCGISAGANLYAAKQIAEKYLERLVVSIVPDSGERYLSVW